MNRVRHGTTTVAIAACVAAALWASPGLASPVCFINPPSEGHYSWYTGGPPRTLCVTLPPESQPTVPTSTRDSFQQVVVPNSSGQVLGGGGGKLQSLEQSSLLRGAEFGDSISQYMPEGFTWAPMGKAYDSGLGSLLPEGEQKYLCVSFNFADGTRYGWIGVVRSGATLDAFAWGYETTINTRIAAGAGLPEPATLSLLVFGMVGLMRRGRRA